MNLLRFSKDEIHFRKSKIRFYHNSQRSHKGSRPDLLRPAAQRATVGAFRVGQPHGIPGIQLGLARVLRACAVAWERPAAYDPGRSASARVACGPARVAKPQEGFNSGSIVRCSRESPKGTAGEQGLAGGEGVTP
jgi:hypothetical protein